VSLDLTSGQLKSVALASTTKLVSLALVMKTKSLALDSETCPYWVTVGLLSSLTLCYYYVTQILRAKITTDFVHSENLTAACKMFKQT